MTGFYVIPALLAQVAMVFGQILLKRAMQQNSPRRRYGLRFAAAIACMTLYFFLWLGVARDTPLSQLAPFDALGPVMLVAAVHVMLHERLSVQAWVGVSLILVGVGVIAFS